MPRCCPGEKAARAASLARWAEIALKADAGHTVQPGKASTPPLSLTAVALVNSWRVGFGRRTLIGAPLIYGLLAAAAARRFRRGEKSCGGA